MERTEKSPQPEYIPPKTESPQPAGDFSLYAERSATAEKHIKEIEASLDILKKIRMAKEERLLRMEEEISRRKLLHESLPLKALIEASQKDIVRDNEKIEKLELLREQLIRGKGDQVDKHEATKKYLEQFEPKIEQ